MQTIDISAAAVACEAILGVPAVQPVLGQAITVRAGKGTKLVQHFIADNKGFSAYRAEGKAQGFQGKALSAWVNEQFFKDKPTRNQMAVAWVQNRMSLGEVADTGTITKGGSCLRFVKPAKKVTKAEANLASVLELAKSLKPAEMQQLLAGLTPAA